MAHTRKDTLTKPVEWWKHLRPFSKKRVSKRERIAGKKEIEVEVTETDKEPSLSAAQCYVGKENTISEKNQ